eukprot:TRINITY_DN4478_c0_g1_i1.p2 TRINITY_DN4478_c0_g1~~TRINITY_DN4478_c0_g1_i1.p2  ORF type:complete len:111 (-),score=12.59 TRINITY_DN4478_c0_g1_i1:203-535(-)
MLLTILFFYTDYKDNVNIPDRLESDKVVIIIKGNLEGISEGNVAEQFGKYFGFRVGHISKNRLGDVMRIPIPKDSVSRVLAHSSFEVDGRLIKIERYKNKYHNSNSMSEQ